MKQTDIHNFFVNRDIDVIKIPFEEYKRLFNNFKNAIENKMYINKQKRIKELSFIDKHIKNIISMNIFFKIVSESNWEEFNKKQLDSIEYFKKSSNDFFKGKDRILSKNNFLLLKEEIENFFNEINKIKKYLKKYNSSMFFI